jgi:hypothetical protein
MTAIRLVAPCQRFQFRAAGNTCFVKDVPLRHAIDIPIADRVSRIKFHSVHLRRLPKSKIGNLKLHMHC